MARSAWLSAGLILIAMTAVAGDGKIARNPHRIPGQYILVLEQGADTGTVANAVRSLKGGRVHHTYARGLKGLAVDLSDADAQALARDPRVRSIEEDAVVSATSEWPLDRIDQRSLPLDGSYVSAGTGAGVTVYVVDTGIFAGHADFGGRVTGGFTAFTDNAGTNDCNGHGTHVAGIVGGAKFGVATSATLVPVRVLDCNGAGSISTLLAGLDWVLQDHAQKGGPAIVNMSLSGSGSSALDTVVNNVLASGMTAVSAAGNDNGDACGTSPARVPGGLTVGASTESDHRATFSNYGACVDLFAPGTNIVSDSPTSATGTAVASGTSQAAPFVAGVAALYLEKYPTASPATVTQAVVSQATVDVLNGASPNLLLYSLLNGIDPVTGDAQLLGDPGFDFGTTFWAASICTVIDPTSCPPTPEDPPLDGAFLPASAPSHSGNSHASIGGVAKPFYLASETLTIPSTVRKAELSVYLWVFSKNKKPAPDDVLTIDIRDASGALLATVGTFTNLDANTSYTQRRFDVTRFRGVPIRISFTGVQSQGPPTWFLLDDAAVQIWK